MAKIIVQNIDIAVLGVEGEDYISPFYEIGKFVNAER